MSTFDGYIRVSRTNGRAGSSFLSPKEQRATIERLAAHNGLTLGEIVEELDVSGGKKADNRPELARLVQKVEAGESGGLIVWKVTRFSRDLADGVVTAQRITSVGGRLIASDCDTDMPMGKAMLGFLLGWAEEELDARREGWSKVNDYCAANGIYQGALPVGFTKGRTRALKGTPTDLAAKQLTKTKDAETIGAAFKVKANGGSYREAARVLEAAGVKTAAGADRWGATSLRSMLRNPIYRGSIVNGHEHVFPEYAVVSPSVWTAVQTTVAPVPDTTAANGGRQSAGDWALLGGLVKCGGCGKRVAPNSTRRKLNDGSERVHREYGCKRIDCDSKGRANADELEAYVIEEAYSYFAQAVEANGGAGHGKDTDTEKLTGLEIEAEEARKRLTEFVALVDPTDPGAKERIDALRATMQAAEAAVANEREATRVIVTPEEMRAAFEEADLAGRRGLVRMMLDGVVITGRKKDGTVQERAEIEYRVLVFGSAA